MTIFRTIFERDFNNSLLVSFEKFIDYNVRLIVLDEQNHDLYLMVSNIFSELKLLSKHKSCQLPEHYYQNPRYIRDETICCAIRQQRTSITSLMAEVLRDGRLVCPEANYVVSRTAILSLTNIFLCAYHIQLIDRVNLSKKEDLGCLNEEETITKKKLVNLVSAITFAQSPTVVSPIRRASSSTFPPLAEYSILDTSEEENDSMNIVRP